MNHLTGAASGGLNGSTFVSAATAHDDGATDTAPGGSGLDWFISSAGDVLGDRLPRESVLTV